MRKATAKVKSGLFIFRANDYLLLKGWMLQARADGIGLGWVYMAPANGVPAIYQKPVVAVVLIPIWQPFLN